MLTPQEEVSINKSFKAKKDMDAAWNAHLKGKGKGFGWNSFEGHQQAAVLSPGPGAHVPPPENDIGKGGGKKAKGAKGKKAESSKKFWNNKGR